ncbi:hypothetical protein FB446DRAFT_701189 [Lentinula raphanica]|nr:hypothetical protein FB446DRAFT_701189 [Lentinula raphanica]
MSSSSAAGSCLQNPDVMKKGDFLNRVRETVPDSCEPQCYDGVPPPKLSQIGQGTEFEQWILSTRVTASQKAKIWKGEEHNTALDGDSQDLTMPYLMLTSVLAFHAPDYDRSRVNRLIIRADERFEMLILIRTAKKLEARLISGDEPPNRMELNPIQPPTRRRPSNGKIEVHGLPSIGDVFELLTLRMVVGLTKSAGGSKIELMKSHEMYS